MSCERHLSKIPIAERRGHTPTTRFGRTDLMLLALVSVWGVNFSVVKGAISGSDAPFSPIAFNAIRFSIAAVCLLALVRWIGEAAPASRGDRLPIFGLGLLGNSLYQVLFIVGIDFTSPANSSLILATVPVTVALIGAALRIEKLTALAWIGIVLSFAGIALVVLGNQAGAARIAQSGVASSQSASSLFGDALILLAAMVWALYTTLSAPLLRRYSATTVTSLSLAAGTIPLILIALPDLVRLNWSAIPIAGWSAAVFSGTLALAAGYAAWNRGVKHLGGARTAVYSNLVPVIAAGVAWIARGDALTVYHLIGAAIILSGINLTRIGRQTRSIPLPAEE